MAATPIKPLLKSRQDWHIYWVFTDKDFINEVKLLKNRPKGTLVGDSEWRRPYKELGKKYCVPHQDIYRFKKSGFNAIGIAIGHVGRNFVLYDEKYQIFQAFLAPNITHREFSALWASIRDKQKNILKLPETKRKHPEDTLLIYSVFKARSNGQTFTKIFQLYQEGKLYGGNKITTNKFAGADDLKKYYYKYKPINPTSNT